jgi:molybdopterin-guanine dinucleotide biosynthesis protein A
MDRIRFETMDVTGILLTGRDSRRMGREKGLVDLNGVHLIQHAIRLAERYCKKVIIGANSSEYSRFGYPVLTDAFGRIGPIGGLLTCLGRYGTEINLLLAQIESLQADLYQSKMQ